MSKSKLTVVISGFSGTFIAEPGGAVASALRKAFGKNIKIIALAYSSWTNAAYTKDLVDDIYLIQPLNDIGNHYNDLLRVFQLCQPDVYIPTLELEVKYLRYFIGHFRQTGPKTLIPEILHFDRVSKLGLHYFCNDNQFLYPKTMVTNNSVEFNYIINRTLFPCLIKSALNGASLVHNFNEAHEAAQRFSNFWQQPILIQEYIAGDQYMVASLLSEERKSLKTIFARKHLVNHFGKSAITVMVEQPTLQETASHILDKLDWSGPLELEFIKAADNHYYLFEINPRFPSWIDISSTIEDNLPALLVNHLQGKQSVKSSHNNGCDVLLRDTDEVCIPVRDFYQLQKKGVLQHFNSDVKLKSVRGATQATIAITGVSSLHLPMPGLSLAKALKNSGHFNLVCFAESYQDTGCYRTDLFDHVCQINLNVHEKEVLKQITLLCKTIHLQAIIPTLDRHVEIFIKIEKELDKLGIKTLLPHLKSLQRVYQFPKTTFTKKNIHVPNSWLIKNIHKIAEIVEKTGYPVVLKTIGPEKSCIKVIYTPAMLAAAYTSMNSRQKELTYLLQQHIEGEHFAIFGLASEKSELVSGVVIKAIQTCIYGKIWMATQMKTLAAKPFLDFLSSLISELQWKGPIEIDCIRDKYTDIIYCIDINPRFPSWTYYASILEPTLLSTYLQSLLGINIKPHLQKKDDFLYIRLPKNYYSDIGVLGKLISGKELEYTGGAS